MLIVFIWQFSTCLSFARYYGDCCGAAGATVSWMYFEVYVNIPKLFPIFCMYLLIKLITVSKFSMRICYYECTVYTVLIMKPNLSPFHFVSFHFISFRFISFRFVSFHFVSFHFTSFNLITKLYLKANRFI